jgi:predicted small metal-binding protein
MDNFKTTATSEKELMNKIQQHAKTAHNMDTISPDIMTKIKKAIKTS